jgi:hypothetical protein
MPNLKNELINDALSVDLDSTQTLSNKTLTTPIINGPTITATGQTPIIHGIYLPEPHVIYFEGSTADDFETILTVVNPTADRTVSLPDGSGTLTLANSDVTFANLTVSGDLTVNGNTTTLNTANLNVEDSFILLNSGVTGSPTLDSGLEVERGTSTNVFIRWNETTDKWQFTNDGSTYNDLGSGGATNSLTAPVSPAAGALWFKTDTAQTFVYYVDGTSNQWVEIGSSGMAAYIADSAPNNPIAGQFWYNSSEASTYVYYDSQWIEIGASGMSAIISDTAPTNPITGQIWYNSSDGGTYVYYNSIWVEIGAAPFNTLLSSINAKGDLLVGTANDTVAGLTAGSNGTFLKANSATATGLEWASIPAINTLDDVGDVTITSASSGQVLQWNGTAWINATVSSDVMTDAKNAALIIMDIGA